MASSAAISGVGQHSWFLDYRAGDYFGCLAAGLFRFQVGGSNPNGGATTANATGTGIRLLPRGDSVNAIWDELAAYPFMVASSLPLNVPNVAGVVAHAFQSVGRERYFLGLRAGVFCLCIMLLRFTVRLHELRLFFGGTVMAFLHVRFVLLFVPFFAPLLATSWRDGCRSISAHKDKYVLNAILMSVVVVAMVHYMPSRADLKEIVSSNSRCARLITFASIAFPDRCTTPTDTVVI